MRFLMALAFLMASILMASIFVFPAFAADDVLDAIDQARKAYQANNPAEAKQQLDLASQLIGRKNSENLVEFLPQPLPGWNADKAQIESGIMGVLAGSVVTRSYKDVKGSRVEVQIAGNSPMMASFSAMLANPQVAGMMGKLIHVGNLMAVQSDDGGDVSFVVANKYFVTVTGSASKEDKLAYAQAVDVSRLTKL